MLYVVGTPVGNLEDITLRALKVLKESDIIVCENKRHTLKLLNHYGIKKPLLSYHEHNKSKKLPKIINLLKENKNIALVSDAGTPCISDPGFLIVREAIKEEIPLTVIPGAFAGILGLVLSGLPTDRFVFEGFLPRRKGKRKKRLKSLKKEERTVIIYESPHRVLNLLKEILEIVGDIKVSLARELTKVHEEVLRGKVSEIIEELETRRPLKGEFVLILSLKD